MNATKVIDCAVHHDWDDQAEVVQYLGKAWKEYVGEPGSLPWGFGSKYIGLDVPYKNPTIHDPYVSSFQIRSDSERPMRSVNGLIGELDGEGVDAGILVYGSSMLLPGDNNVYLGKELISAANRWTQEMWLEEGQGRLWGSILVPNQLPVEAAKEIRNYASSRYMIQVAIGANGLSKPLGHPIYDPIYKAACDLGLPVVINSFGDALIDSLAHPTAGGPPAGYVESRVLASQPLITHACSLIAQGTFEKFRDLQVVLIGAGVAWLPSFLWRFDVNMGAFGRESPWLTKSPLEYFESNFHVCTYRLGAVPSRQRFELVAGKVSTDGSMYMYGSGRPFADFDPLARVREIVPAEWHSNVLGGSARALYPRLSIEDVSAPAQS